MSEGFANAVVGGAETLIRTAIKSFGYVAGVFGWRIARNGDAEFNDASVRGVIEVSGADDSLIRIWNDGTDPQNPGPKIDLFPPNLNLINIFPAEILATNVQPIPGSDEEMMLIIVSPHQITGTTSEERFSQILMRSGGSTDFTTIIALNATQVVVEDTFGAQPGQLIVGGNDIGRGIVAIESTLSDSASIGTSETVILTISSQLYHKNRLYSLNIVGRIAQDTAGTGPQLRWRKTNVAGTSITLQGRIATNGNVEYAPPGPVYFIVGNADVTTAICLTIAASVGNVLQRGPRAIFVRDEGANDGSLGVLNLPELS